MKYKIIEHKTGKIYFTSQNDVKDSKDMHSLLEVIIKYRPQYKIIKCYQKSWCLKVFVEERKK